MVQLHIRTLSLETLRIYHASFSHTLLACITEFRVFTGDSDQILHGTFVTGRQTYREFHIGFTDSDSLDETGGRNTGPGRAATGWPGGYIFFTIHL